MTTNQMHGTDCGAPNLKDDQPKETAETGRSAERVKPADSVAQAAGKALDQAYPWGYGSTDSEP